MPKESDRVGKVFVKVRRGEKTYYLFSKKRAPGSKKHKHLELLGGKIGEASVIRGTVRELREEETTGFLARKLRRQHLKHEVEIEGAVHHIFEVSIEYDEFKDLEHGEGESLGFKLVPASRLNTKKFRLSLTRKTEMIFEALDIGAWGPASAAASTHDR